VVGDSPTPINHYKRACDSLNTATKIMATIKLMDEQVDEITLIDSNNKYKSTTKRGAEGKTFSRFRYDGKVFTVDNDNPFIAAFNASTVNSVKLVESTRVVVTVDAEGNEESTDVPTLAFDSFGSYAQALNRAEHKYKIARFTHLATAPITADLLSELENA
jgi:hypothetical protein